MLRIPETFVASLLLGLPSLGAALPALGAQDLFGRNLPSIPVACIPIDTVLTVLEIAPSASPFCSSFLGIKTSTVYKTTTQSIYQTDFVTLTTGTNTVTAPISFAPTSTLPAVTAPTTTFTNTADAITVTTCQSTSSVPVQKRNLPISVVTTTRTNIATISSQATTSSTTRKPTISSSTSVPTPSCVNGLAPAAISLACSCLSVPTPTFTSTVTQTSRPTIFVTSDVAASVTTTPVTIPYFTPTITPSTTVTITPTSTNNFCPSPTPDSSCNNQGLQFAYYTSPFRDISNDYAEFDPTYFKSQAPIASGAASSAGGIGGNCSPNSPTFNFYGQDESCNTFAINYRGYLYAPTTGVFTFTLTAADDIVFIWGGDVAYSGWDESNYLLRKTYVDLGGTNGAVATLPVTAGQYVPYRMVFGQGGGPFGFNVQVTAPDGTVVLSASSSSNQYSVQYSCDGTLGPQHVPFGQET